MENNEDKNVDKNEDRIVLTEETEAPKTLGLQKKIPWFVIAISSLGLIVIILAFVIESVNNRKAALPEIKPQPAGSAVQAEINGLDWIEQSLLSINPYSRPGIALEAVNGIVIHNIGNPGTTAEQNRNYFENLSITHETHASSNFIICIDGSIIQCVPVDEVAYASNTRNDDTLSIEVCHPDDTGAFTEESYAAAVKLTAWLCARYDLKADDVLRHFDVYGKECPRYFVDNEDAWKTFKADVMEICNG